MTHVFVYGTLKRGFYNYEAYLKPAIEMGKASYIGTGRTLNPDFCLVLKKNRFVPCLYRPLKDSNDTIELEANNCPASGYTVPGEVYLVDEDSLRALDILEGVDEGYYLSEQTDIIMQDGSICNCVIYIKPIDDTMSTLTRIPEYTEEMHVHYAAKQRTPKFDILSCLYGEELILQVQSLLETNQEMNLETAIKLKVKSYSR